MYNGKEYVSDKQAMLEWVVDYASDVGYKVYV